MRTVKYITSEDDNQISRDLQIDHVLFYIKNDSFLIVLNNCDIIKAKISDYPLLNGADLKKLNNYKITLGGTALHWEDLDEDLSLCGFFKDASAYGSIEKIEALKIDTRPSLEKIVLLCIYVNLEGLSRKEIESECAKIMDDWSHTVERYRTYFKSFDIFICPVSNNQETKIEFFTL